MQRPPLALIATEDTAKAARWQTVLADRGISTQPALDRADLDRWIAEPAGLDAVVCDAPFVTAEDLAAIKANTSAYATAPATVMVIPACEPTRLAESLSAGLDLPIVGDSSPEAVADAALVLLDSNATADGEDPIWELDAVAWQIIPPNGSRHVPLTFKEREFLLKLARQPGQPLPKETFVGLFGTTVELFDPRRLEIMVRRLRNKVRDYAKTELPLHTAHGLGYALATPVKINGTHTHSDGSTGTARDEGEQG